MDSYLQVCLPYCFQLEQRDGKAVYVPMNRRYQRIFADLVFAESLYSLAKQHGLYVDPETIYLYDDATAPDVSEPNRARYFAKLSAISKLGVDVLRPPQGVR